MKLIRGVLKGLPIILSVENIGLEFENFIKACTLTVKPCVEVWSLFQPISMKQSFWEVTTGNNAVQSLVYIVVPSTEI